MTIEIAKQELKKFIEKYPEKKEQAYDFYYLMTDEIEEGGSTEHEVSLFLNELEQL